MSGGSVDPGGKGVEAVVVAGVLGPGEDMDSVLDGGIRTGGEGSRGGGGRYG